jgi:hypothetical protein
MMSDSSTSDAHRDAYLLWEMFMSSQAYTRQSYAQAEAEMLPPLRRQPAPDATDMAAARERLDGLARVLDSAVRIPGTSIQVGADAMLNLIPGIGTLAAKGVSGYLIWEARRLGVPTSTLLRMAGNVGVDTVISAVPVLGWFGDVFWRANTRNITLLRAHLDRSQIDRRAK